MKRTGRRAHYFAGGGTQLSKPTQPNQLWCADYKRDFMLPDRRYCYPRHRSLANSACYQPMLDLRVTDAPFAANPRWAALELFLRKGF